MQISWNGTTEAGLLPDGDYDYQLSVASGQSQLVPLSGRVRIDNTPPQAPLLMYPAAAAKVTGTPTLEWEQLHDAAYFLVALGKGELPQAAEIVHGATFKPAALESGQYSWQVTAVDEAGNHSLPAESSFSLTALQTDKFALVNAAIAPNPFTPNGDGRRERLLISYTLQQEAEVKLWIYNLSGKLVRAVELGQQASGDHFISWDGTDRAGVKVSAGTYLLRLVATNPNYGAPAVVQRPLLVIK